MNVAHEVVVVNTRHTALTLEPQTNDPSALLRPSTLLIDEKGTGFELAVVGQNDTFAMKPITEVQIHTTSVELVDRDEHQTNPISSTLRESGHRRKCSSEDGIHYVDDDDGVEFQLDTKHLNRVHEELEKLNIATDVINKMELQLDHAREKFQKIHSEWRKRSDEIQKKYDSAIKKSRPYYETVKEEQQLQEKTQQATNRFEKANSMLQVAKQQVQLTQDSLNRQKIVQPDCLEVLNHHVQRVNEAEQERLSAEKEHFQLSQQLIQCTQRVKQLFKENSRSIKKVKHYFEQFNEFKKRLDDQKTLISRLDAEVKQKKRDYTSSLRNLEQISDSIHEERSLTSTKHSARTPDSTRKSVSIVGLSKLQSSVPESRTASSVNEGATDSHSITSSSSGGISMDQRDPSISDFCADMPDTLTIDDYLDLKIDASTSSHHGRSVSELSGLGNGSSSTTPKKRIGNDVILLAQRLINREIIPSNNDGICKRETISDNDEVCYHTAPQGISSVAEPTIDSTS